MRDLLRMVAWRVDVEGIFSYSSTSHLGGNMRIWVAQEKSEYRKEQQDVHLVLKNTFVSGDVLVIVADGHGETHGKLLAQTVTQLLAHKFTLLTDPFSEEEIHQLFAYAREHVECMLEGHESGTTVALFYRSGQRCLVANVGDSTVEAVFRDGIYVLTEEHSTRNQQECERLLTKGWTVNQHTGYFIPEREDQPMIAVSRAFGDEHLSDLRAIPFIRIFEVDAHEPCYFLIATDGIEYTVWKTKVPLYQLLRQECDIGGDVFKIALEASARENVTAVLVSWKL